MEKQPRLQQHFWRALNGLENRYYLDHIDSLRPSVHGPKRRRRMKKLTDWLMGRTTMFCVSFFLVGNVLQLMHRLDGVYVAFMGTLLGAVIGHSIKEDHSDADKPTD